VLCLPGAAAFHLLKNTTKPWEDVLAGYAAAKNQSSDKQTKPALSCSCIRCHKHGTQHSMWISEDYADQALHACK
jgi:hypothetical protein